MLLKPSRYEELNREAVDLLETYGITEFPLDVFHLARKMGMQLRPYSSTPLAEHSPFGDVSEDAFTVSPGKYEVGTTFICFNQNAAKGRLRQDIAHEIAHIWLEHLTSEEPFETEAEYFAAYLLAPIPLIIKYRLETIQEVQRYHHKISSGNHPRSPALFWRQSRSSPYRVRTGIESLQLPKAWARLRISHH